MLRKFYNILFLCISIICCVNAQDIPVNNYLQQAGEYADIYNGEIEVAYSLVQYKNLPYYTSADFTDGANGTAGFYDWESYLVIE